MKTCSSDPVPTQLIKLHTDAVTPHLTEIINESLAASTVPASMKKALVTPVLKKTGLNKEELQKYRPVSHLSLISKLLEKAVATQLSHYLAAHKMQEVMQTAYHACCSVETAQLHVHNNILGALDTQQGAFLILLSLTAAVDTTDHQILLKHPEQRFGTCGTALHHRPLWPWSLGLGPFSLYKKRQACKRVSHFKICHGFFPT